MAAVQKVFFNRNPLINLMSKVSHWLNRNSKTGSRRNISAHYDLGNAFYTQWLDPSMTYSSAIFEDGANSLEEAQEAKISGACRQNRYSFASSCFWKIGCGLGWICRICGVQDWCQSYLFDDLKRNSLILPPNA